ncbi:helix-turn-helix transcriptional regulator [Armatimonas sp.]|uniref:helix-turn-helix transcriptional regulator n=1 Tax=Armatimonas sp. TaxID=1872638 RepID=UPI00375153C0
MPTGSPRLRTQDGKLNQVATTLKERRKALKLTQDNLCGRLAEVTQGRWTPQWRDIVRIERGTRIVSDLEVIALCRVLDCSLIELLDTQILFQTTEN